MSQPSTLGLAFSHMGIFVTDLPKMTDFYTKYLGFTITDHGTLETPYPPYSVDIAFLSRNPDEHHQIVLATGRPPDLAFNTVNQISLRADSLATLKTFHKSLEGAPITGMRPVTHGNAMSVYFQDPEDNRVEVFIDTPWYVSQPMRVTLPIEMPDDELMQWVEAHARKLPNFQPRAQWRAEMAKRMGVA